MINLQEINIHTTVVHYVGNQSNNEPLVISEHATIINTEVEMLLKNLLQSSFKSSDLYNFYHDVNLELNELNYYSSLIFDNNDSFQSQSINISKKLYECSSHPKIKSGEIIIMYLTNCVLDSNNCDALVIIKSENKDSYLKINQNNNSFDFKNEEGINIDSIDKGCIILNLDKENGYIISAIDNTNKGNDARFWFDDFLHLKNRNDNYFKTNQMLSLCKKFALKELPNHIAVSKAEQADILNKSINYFKEKDNYYSDDFSAEVLQSSEIINIFNDYKDKVQDEIQQDLTDSFTISEQAVKKQSRAYKSVIKLDRNFHIYIHGSNQFIQKGYDEKTGMNFYQLFFKEEL